MQAAAVAAPKKAEKPAPASPAKEKAAAPAPVKEKAAPASPAKKENGAQKKGRGRPPKGAAAAAPPPKRAATGSAGRGKSLLYKFQKTRLTFRFS